jgi:hypothetical protein
LAERHHGDDARRAVDAAKDAHGREQRVALLELNLLRVIPPVNFRLGASAARGMEGFGRRRHRLSGDTT